MNFILCKDCQKHQAPQDWLKEKFNPQFVPGNLYKVYKEFNNDNAIINSIQVESEHQAVGIADIEDVADDGDAAYV